MKINDKNKNSGDTTKKQENMNNLDCLEYFYPTIPIEYGYIIFIIVYFLYDIISNKIIKIIYPYSMGIVG